MTICDTRRVEPIGLNEWLCPYCASTVHIAAACECGAVLSMTAYRATERILGARK